MDAAAKQQIVERIRQANNILVTVSNNPSVDQLAACIGLTLLLNRMEKHATAVFSGQVPSTLEFLQPEKTIETNTDSLRDFIISLDKNKADKLRYKVEDQVVKIFITPYKTSLSEKDLIYSQGDFNVEVVIALGVKDRTQIDAAITAHGRILHDATVISLNTGQGKQPDIGQINWQDPATSSLSEMLVSISEAFGAGLIDNQMATAFLTGIVAETNRFSNAKTTPKVMTMAAQLMAAGANQQLIVSKLEPPMPQGMKTLPSRPAAKPVEKGALKVDHDNPALGARLKAAEKAQSSEVEVKSDEIHIDEQGNIKTAADLPIPPEAEPEEPEEPKETSTPTITLPTPIVPINRPVAKEDVGPPEPHALLNPDNQSPVSGGTFAATTQPEWTDPYNSVSFDPLSAPPDNQAQIIGRDPLSPSTSAPTPSGSPSNVALTTPPSLDNARNAVESALEAAPFDPAFAPPVQALNATQVDLAAPGDSTPTPPNQPPTAAPPFPPPLSPVNGVVIPPMPTNGVTSAT